MDVPMGPFGPSLNWMSIGDDVPVKAKWLSMDWMKLETLSPDAVLE
jgi:hypothetical protein